MTPCHALLVSSITWVGDQPATVGYRAGFQLERALRGQTPHHDTLISGRCYLVRVSTPITPSTFVLKVSSLTLRRGLAGASASAQSELHEQVQHCPLAARSRLASVHWITSFPPSPPYNAARSAAMRWQAFKQIVVVRPQAIQRTGTGISASRCASLPVRFEVDAVT